MATIQQFREAWADKENRAAAFEIAREYVAENAALLDPILGNLDSDQLVGLIDLARLAGQDDEVTRLTMYELVGFERRNVGGSINMVGDANLPKRLRGGDA